MIRPWPHHNPWPLEWLAKYPPNTLDNVTLRHCLKVLKDWDASYQLTLPEIVSRPGLKKEFNSLYGDMPVKVAEMISTITTILFERIK